MKVQIDAGLSLAGASRDMGDGGGCTEERAQDGETEDGEGGTALLSLLLNYLELPSVALH